MIYCRNFSDSRVTFNYNYYLIGNDENVAVFISNVGTIWETGRESFNHYWSRKL